MKIGFTGTREGMTEKQKEEVRWWLIKKNPTEVHHGDCIGADEEFHGICEELGIPTRGHPPKNPKYRAFCNFSLGMEPEKGYFVRNRDIVNAVDMMIGTPKSEKETGGTWYTINYSFDSGKLTLTVYP